MDHIRVDVCKKESETFDDDRLTMESIITLIKGGKP